MTTHEIIQNTDKNLYLTENRDKSMEDYQQHLNDHMGHESELQSFEPEKNLSPLQYRDDKLNFRMQKEASPVNWVDKSMMYPEKRLRDDNFRNINNKEGSNINIKQEGNNISIKQESGNNYQQNGPLPPFMN